MPARAYDIGKEGLGGSAAPMAHNPSPERADWGLAAVSPSGIFPPRGQSVRAPAALAFSFEVRCPGIRSCAAPLALFAPRAPAADLGLQLGHEAGHPVRRSLRLRRSAPRSAPPRSSSCWSRCAARLAWKRCARGGAARRAADRRLTALIQWRWWPAGKTAVLVVYRCRSGGADGWFVLGDRCAVCSGWSMRSPGCGLKAGARALGDGGSAFSNLLAVGGG